MTISIITPSFNQSSLLEQAILSVLDQRYANVEHIIIDGASRDNSINILKKYEHQLGLWRSEKDNGMYDALNKGFNLSSGEIIGHLNCDEQYLPYTLSHVAEVFLTHPEIDIVFGSVLLVKPDGTLVGYRKAYTPRWYYICSSHLYVSTCAMFFRRKILNEGFRYDARFRMVGDHDFIVRLLRHGYQALYDRKYFSAFAVTGTNMGVSTAALEELSELIRTAPFWVRYLRQLLNGARLFEKLLSGAYFQEMPLEYDVYTSSDLVARKHFRVEHATFRWTNE